MKPKKLESLEGLIGESLALAVGLRSAAESIHADLGITPGTRVLLATLAEIGPATVPRIARARGVSRQHVQTVVNSFLKRGWVKRTKNPEHERSQLVHLTRDGRRLLKEMDRRERRTWRLLELEVKRADLDAASAVLSRVRRLLDSDAMRRAVSRVRGQ